MKKLLIILIGLVLPYATRAAVPATWRSVTVVGTNITMPTIPGTVIATGTPAVGDVLTASSGTGTNGVWGAPNWYSYTATDAEGGTIYGTASTNSILPNGVNFAANYLTNFWGDLNMVFAVGYPQLDVTNIAASNVGIFSVGDYSLYGATLSNVSDLYAYGEFTFRGATIDHSGSLFGSGYNTFRDTTISHASDLYAFGSTAFNNSTVNGFTFELFALGLDNFGFSHYTGDANLYAIGHNHFGGSALDGCSDMYAFGSQNLTGLTLTNSSDIYAIGGSAGSGLTGSGLSHVFIVGSNGKATNSNDWVAGDSVYNYFFPGASMRVEGLVSAAVGVSSTANDAAVSIAATGWTNTFGKAAVVRFDGTAMTYTVYDNAGTSLYTNAVSVGHSTELLQTGAKLIVSAGTGVSGRASPW